MRAKRFFATHFGEVVRHAVSCNTDRFGLVRYIERCNEPDRVAFPRGAQRAALQRGTPLRLSEWPELFPQAVAVALCACARIARSHFGTLPHGRHRHA